MRILVTNDDGVAAPGLVIAEEIARAVGAEVAGEKAEIWVVAPAFEQSGVSHAISFNAPVQVEQLAERRWAVAGTPADCVLIAVHGVMKETPPDLVISGVNRGHNFGEDAVYSGTVGGALEGALQGVKSISLSQYCRRQHGAPREAMFDAARGHGAAAVLSLLDAEWERDRWYNVNFPPIPAAEVKGRRFAPQGRRDVHGFRAEERLSPAGRTYFWITHHTQNQSAPEGTDVALCADGWVTVTPMKPNYTDHPAMAQDAAG